MNGDGTIQLVNTSLCLDINGRTSAGGYNVVIESVNQVGVGCHAMILVFHLYWYRNFQVHPTRRIHMRRGRDS